ncbi:hypothetical protein COW36_08595 [bacterium (Candidatus Blackallbacteria) CG17_big_fil_post_rev_8_21_14_2_50_48_46]|uniref:Uncharacterized protein n=1 Tax=bacterium (Candidatus Blackallbacteria) CG17_big_fil_post_rev_8_21_14_2_50_48_46 TaxID=2014261 RepID=A0A2M7G6C6_9BACT|nr:MAG: hypothetical protein COW64_05895 [bacterium (Candidatus Blackallbacteria) CG18_big_fil_WC_8_21_14_2_50_49_26]PIW17545.1 MAG: hypothetical protein COW36_08595 [bacterium (Candidatus Blackallbacteria) CG17_big_fil_post_rev_8_21_14_2_50_48_46]PIW48400.1 MAG: hypothetical protein COW20_09945 [bacterium (Candidatus Blackallbacteria) CG13_big_fil_rev_8_21_14_2_50_49_14]
MRHPWKIGLVQINSNAMNYLPYSVGLLQAYAQEHASQPDIFEFLIPIHKPVSLAQARWYFREADLVGFSTYMWNVKRTLAIAQAVKETNPQALIVLGGPQVPDRAEKFLRENPFIDLCVHGEGEAVFLHILEQLETRDWQTIAGISYLKQNQFVYQAPGARIKDINQIPSPYLKGIFEPLIRSQIKPTKWSAMWETNRGCPFSCSFCDWGSAVQSKIYSFDLERLNQEIDWFVKYQLEFVFCCDANFGILPRDVELARQLAATKKEWGYPRLMSFQNAKNATERVYEIQTLLYGAELNSEVTLSMQSIDPHTLESIRRENISLESFKVLQQRFTRDGIITYTDIIVGLPGESYDSFAEGINTLLGQGQHSCIKFHNLAILPNAEMGHPDYIAKYGLETVEVPLANAHRKPEEAIDGIEETQELVIGSKSMSREDWVRTRVFAWVTGLFHFRKEWLQLPFILLANQAGISYRESLEWLIQAPERFPLLHAGIQFLIQKARSIQAGDYEFVMGEGEWAVFWLADEYLFINWILAGQVDQVYAESEAWLKELLKQRNTEFSEELLSQAIALSRLAFDLDMKPGPFEITLDWNLWDYYQGILKGEPVELRQIKSSYLKDWEGKPFTLENKLKAHERAVFHPQS